MSNSIANQTWEIIEEVNFSISEQQKAQKQGDARIAEAHHLTRLQRVEKDIVLPSDPHGNKETIKKSKEFQEKPRLPNPERNWDGVQDKHETGLISIIAKVLALQARTNSNFWSTLWKQASQSMMMEVKFAPIIGNAIENAADAQSNATKQEAAQSMADGVVNLLGFVGAVVGGTVMEMKDPTIKDDDATEFDKPGEAKPNKLENSTENLAKEKPPENSLRSDVNEALENKKQWSNRLMKAGGRAKRIFGRAKKNLPGIFNKVYQASQMSQMATQATTGIMNQTFLNKKAGYQGEEGQFQALSKESEQYAQFYGQSFGREDQLGQGANQHISDAVGIIRSAADTITQTVTSMFRG